MNRNSRVFLLTLIVGLVNVQNAPAAGMQKWVDANGKVHYGQRPPADTASQSVTTKISVTSSPGVKANEVVLYSTTRCGYCKKAKAYMRKNGIKFREYYIDKDKLAQRRYKNAGGVGVPFLVRGNEVLQGFASANYDRFFAK